MRHSFLLLALLTTAVQAQTPLVPQPTELPRGVTRLSTGFVSTSNAGGAAVKVASPKLEVASTISDTRSLVYVAYMDFDGVGIFATPVLSLRKSTDGGFSWSAPIEVWRSNGDAVSVRDLELHAAGDFVYVSLGSNRVPANPDGTGDGGLSPTGRIQSWVAASNDQGANWQTICVTRETAFPILDGSGNVATQFEGIDDPTRSALGVVPGPTQNGVVQSVSTRLHVVFNVRYQIADGAPPANVGNEDNWYNAVEFSGNGMLTFAFAEPTRCEIDVVDSLNQPVPDQGQAQFDSDDPHIDTDQQLVVIAYQDVSNVTNGATGGSNSSGNDTYVMVSADGGTNFLPRRNLTNLNTAGASGDFNSIPKIIDAQRGILLVTNQDATPSANAGIGATVDEPQTHVSNDFGTTWTSNGAVVRPAGVLNQVDTDEMVVGTNYAGTTWIAWEDDRDNGGNADNDIFVAVDDNMGQDWINGTTTEVRITDTTNSARLTNFFNIEPSTDYLNVDRNGATANLLAFNLLQALDPSNGGNPAEEAAVAYSLDNGATWTVQGLQLEFSNGFGDGDWDEGGVAFTLNGDLVFASTGENAGQGDQANQVYVNGTKFPRVGDNTATGQGITIVDTLGAVDGNKSWILFPSVTAPVAAGFAPALSEFVYNFSTDQLTVDSLALLPLFTVTSDANGVVTPTPLPSFSSILDPLMLDLYYIGIAFDAGVPDRSFTDPIRGN